MKARIASTTPAALALYCLLAACGGGGDDPGPPPPTGDYDARAAWSDFLDGTPGRTASGTGNDNHLYTLRLGAVPVAGSAYPVTATPANRADVVSRLSIDNVVAGNGVTQFYYDDNLNLLGSQDDFAVTAPPVTTTTCDQATTAAVPPTAAKVGQSGPLATSNILDACVAGATVIGTSTLTWSVEFENGIVYFCINADDVDSGSGVRTLEKDCFETDPAGTLGQRARFSLRAPGFAVDMRTP